MLPDWECSWELGAPGLGMLLGTGCSWDGDGPVTGILLGLGCSWHWDGSFTGILLDEDAPGMETLLGWGCCWNRMLLGWGWSSDEADPSTGPVLQRGYSWDRDSPGMKKSPPGNRGLGAAPLQRGCADPGKSLPGMERGDAPAGSGRIQEDPVLRHREVTVWKWPRGCSCRASGLGPEDEESKPRGTAALREGRSPSRSGAPA